MKLEMSEEEIVKSYRNATKKREQIKVLSELNACDKKTIREILRQHGEDVAEPVNRYTLKNQELKNEPTKSITPKVEQTAPEQVIDLVKNRAYMLRQQIEELKLKLGEYQNQLSELENWLIHTKGANE